MPYITKLNSLRLRLNWSQAKLAGKAGIDRATVSRCENEYSITDVSCSKIQDALLTEAAIRNINLGTIVIDPNGEAGSVPKKGPVR